jgi:hypothetical protein
VDYIKYFLIGVATILLGSHPFHYQDTRTKIRVVNSTEFDIVNISMFSKKFENLNPGDTTCYMDIHYNYLKDDPLIYATINDVNLGLYLEIAVENRKNTYIIDSVNLHNKRLYVRLKN